MNVGLFTNWHPSRANENVGTASGQGADLHPGLGCPLRTSPRPGSGDGLPVPT